VPQVTFGTAFWRALVESVHARLGLSLPSSSAHAGAKSWQVGVSVPESWPARHSRCSWS